MADSIELIKTLDLLSNDGVSAIKEARGYKRKKSLKAKIKFFLMGLPSIGEKRAKKIMKDNICVIDYLHYVIQTKKKSEIYKILTSEMEE